MKIVIWLGVMFIGTLLNEMLGAATGIKLGAVLLYLILGAISKAICSNMDDGSASKIEGNWVCFDCKTHNDIKKDTCIKCGMSRSQSDLLEKQSSGAFVPDPVPSVPVTPSVPTMSEIPAWDDGNFTATSPIAPSPNYVAPQPKSVSVLMILTSGPMAGTKFRCREGQEVFIGRDPARCNLVLRGYNVVSGLHCRVDVTGSGMTVKDMGSSNGTYVDGVRLQPNVPVSVYDGGQIRLANQECVFSVKFE